jgi:hypothetical protein
MVRRTTIHKFVTQNGYMLIEKYGKNQTSLMLKLSRPTIDRILRQHPKSPTKTIPKYVFQWEETEGNKMFVEKHQGRVREFRHYAEQGMRAWLLLDKKDPVSWDIEDFRKIWRAEQFRDKNTDRIRFKNAVLFRKWMRTIGRTDLCSLEEFETKGLKRPKGMRKQWFLEDDEILSLIEAMDRKDLLVAFVVSLLSGGRASSIMKSGVSRAHGIRPMDIDDKNHGILMFEPKRKEYIMRLFHPRVIELVKTYIQDSKTKPNEPLFLDYHTMRRYLKAVAVKGKVSKIVDMRGSWHITKHTFVSQGAYHGLSLEVLSEQTGTDPKTLMDYYAGIKEKKMRLELLGEKVDIEPFHEWALRVIIQPSIKQYERLLVNSSESVTSDKR